MTQKEKRAGERRVQSKRANEKEKEYWSRFRSREFFSCTFKKLCNIVLFSKIFDIGVANEISNRQKLPIVE